MANEKNLKLFKKGDPRTIECAKKSKRKPFDKQMQDFFERAVSSLGLKQVNAICEKLGIDAETATVNDVMRVAILLQSMKGNVQAIREGWDRAYGKAPLPMVVSGSLENRVQVYIPDNGRDVKEEENGDSKSGEGNAEAGTGNGGDSTAAGETGSVS